MIVVCMSFLRVVKKKRNAINDRSKVAKDRALNGPINTKDVSINLYLIFTIKLRLGLTLVYK